MKPTLTIKHRPNAGNPNTVIATKVSPTRIRFWKIVNRTFKLLILPVAVLSFLANAFAAYYQHKANEIYHQQSEIYRQQANVALDTEQRELRAYLHITVTDVSINFTNSADFPTEITFEIANDGQTPAHKVKIVSKLKVGEYPALLKVNLAPAEKQFPEGFIPAHGAIKVSVPLGEPFTKDQINKMKKDQMRLYCAGDVTYLDVFNIPRKLRFGFSIPGNAIKTGTDNHTYRNSFKTDYDYDATNNYEY